MSQQKPTPKSDNPFAAPVATSKPGQRVNRRSTTLIVLLSILIVPATLVAGCGTCTAILVVGADSSFGGMLAFFGGATVGVGVFAFMLLQIVRTSRQNRAEVIINRRFMEIDPDKPQA